MFSYMDGYLFHSSGKKFSKRAADPLDRGLVRSLREAGCLPSSVLTWLSATGGFFTSAALARESSSYECNTSLEDCARSYGWTPEKCVEEMLDSVINLPFNACVRK